MPDSDILTFEGFKCQAEIDEEEDVEAGKEQQELKKGPSNDQRILNSIDVNGLRFLKESRDLLDKCLNLRKLQGIREEHPGFYMVFMACRYLMVYRGLILEAHLRVALLKAKDISTIAGLDVIARHDDEVQRYAKFWSDGDSQKLKDALKYQKGYRKYVSSTRTQISEFDKTRRIIWKDGYAQLIPKTGAKAWMKLKVDEWFSDLQETGKPDEPRLSDIDMDAYKAIWSRQISLWSDRNIRRTQVDIFRKVVAKARSQYLSVMVDLAGIYIWLGKLKSRPGASADEIKEIDDLQKILPSFGDFAERSKTENSKAFREYSRYDRAHWKEYEWRSEGESSPKAEA